MAVLVGSGLTAGSTVFDADDAAYNLNGMWGVKMLTLNGVTYVYVTDRNSDGMSVFRVNADGSFTSVQHFLDTGVAGLEIDGSANMTSAVVDGVTYLYANDSSADRINVFSVNDATGELTFVSAAIDDGTGTLELDGTLYAMEVVSVGATQFLVASGRFDNGFTVFSIGAGGALTEVTSVDDSRDAGSRLSVAAGVSSLVVDGKTFLLVSGFEDDAINVFELAGDGSVTFRSAVTDSGALELNGAIDVTTGTVDGTGHVFVSGQNDDGISVFSLAGDGTLTNVFNLTDTEGAGELGLNGAFDLDILTIGGQTFLTAVGNVDSAVSYFSVAADGSLTEVAGLFNTSGLALNGAAYSDTAFIGEGLWLVTGGRSARGLFSIEIGGGADVLVGGVDADELHGLGGNDVLYGLGGTDALLGYAGNDILVGGDGADTLTGGLGDDVYIMDGLDTVVELAGEGNDVAYMLASGTLAANIETAVLFGAGATSLTGTGSGETLIANAAVASTVNGGDGADVIYGSDQVSILNGDGGNDTIVGFGTGADTMSGGAGNDWLLGGAGADTLIGGTGLDILTGAVIGGNGADEADIFRWLASGEFGDVLTDFTSGTDTLEIARAALGVDGTYALTDGTTFRASTNPFSTTAEATFLWDTDDTALYFDADGTGAGAAVLVADFQAGATLAISDFGLF